MRLRNWLNVDLVEALALVGLLCVAMLLAVPIAVLLGGLLGGQAPAAAAAPAVALPGDPPLVLGALVVIIPSEERGVVEGLMLTSHDEPQALVVYKNAQRVAVRQWWPRHLLALTD